MVKRPSPALRSVGPGSRSALFQELCVAYPDVSRRVVGESLERTRDIAMASADQSMINDVEGSTRRLLDGIRARTAAARHRVGLSAPVGWTMAAGREEVDPSELGADAIAAAFSPLHDLGAVSRFDRVSEAIRVQTRVPGSAPSPKLFCRAAQTYLGVAGVAISVPGGLLSSSTVGCAGETARRLEELQVVLGEGPSRDALVHGCAVLVADLAMQEQQARWPVYAPAAVEQGALGQYVLPMQLGGALLGVFVLYLDHSAGLGPAALGEARIFAGIALDWLIDDMSCPGMLDSAHQRDQGPFLDDRPEIHQATGMVSVQLGVDLATALLRLRARAFAEDRGLAEMAADVVARTVCFRDGDRDEHGGRNAATS